MNVIKWLVPAELKFFDMLTEQSENVVAGAKVFNKLLKNYNRLSRDDRKDLVSQIKDIERKGDTINHKINEELNKTFITPFDREDIHEITAEMDDVIDLINGVARRFVLYNIDVLTSEMEEFNSIILECVIEVDLSVKELKQLKNISNHSIKINTLENQADNVSARGIAALFETDSHDPIKVIKHKEIIELMENIVDKCEDIAQIFDSIVIKHA